MCVCPRDALSAPCGSLCARFARALTDACSVPTQVLPTGTDDASRAVVLQLLERMIAGSLPSQLVLHVDEVCAAPRALSPVASLLARPVSSLLLTIRLLSPSAVRAAHG